MFKVTEKARQKVAEHLKGREVMPVRIFLNNGGCGGSQMAMAFDEKKETDISFELSGVEYLIDSEFLNEAKPIEVDFLETGFKITSSIELGGCSSCSSGGSCC